MRFIDLSSLPMPAEWTAEEVGLVNDLAKMTPDERSKAFKTEKYRVWALWSKLLRGLSHGKCWYSEVRPIGAKGDVDHFRPKNAVAKEDAPVKHDGYWWLGVLVNNFRFSCQVCNRRLEDETTGQVQGKGTRFPLRDSATRADNCAPLTAEEPLLLDPTVRADVDLIWFNQDGTVTCKSADPAMKARVEASRVCYHLEDIDILTSRGAVCAEVKEIAETLEEWEKKTTAGESGARRTLIQKKIRLLELTREYSPFSAAARATLKGYDYIDSAKEVLEK